MGFQQLSGQRSSKTTTTMSSTRPTEPPPIQMALPSTGVSNKRCIVCLSFFDGKVFAVVSEMKLRAEPRRGYGVLPDHCTSDHDTGFYRQGADDANISASSLVGTPRCGVIGGKAPFRIAGLRPLGARTAEPVVPTLQRRRTMFSTSNVQPRWVTRTALSCPTSQCTATLA